MVVVIRFNWVFVLNLSYHIRKGFGMFEVVPSVFPLFFVFKVSDYGLFFCFPFFFYGSGSCMCSFQFVFWRNVLIFFLISEDVAPD